MVKLKHKEEELKKKRSKVIGYIGNAKSAAASEQGADPYLEVWGETVDELMTQHFASEQEALEAVISKVMQKMHIAEEENGEMKTFLYDLLQMEPGLMDQLRSTLKVG